MEIILRLTFAHFLKGFFFLEVVFCPLIYSSVIYLCNSREKLLTNIKRSRTSQMYFYFKNNQSTEIKEGKEAHLGIGKLTGSKG